MRLLLDTHVALWALHSPMRVRGAAARHVRDRSNDVLVSIASVWEVAVKASIGRLDLGEAGVDGFVGALRAAEFTLLPIDERHAAAITDLPLLHRDPFDRMLVCQCRLEGLTLVTADSKVMIYDVPMLDASGRA